MNINLLHLEKTGKVIKTNYELPEMLDTQVLIKTKYCGVCRNDIYAFQGLAWQPPLGRFGHEAIGTVIKVGKNVTTLKEGDFVATFDSDPGFADYYYSDESRAVIIPELSPKYILEPLACALNIFTETFNVITMRDYFEMFKIKPDEERNVLILGSGFMSLLIAKISKHSEITDNISFVGRYNKEEFKKCGFELKTLEEVLSSKEKYNAVIDLTGKENSFETIVDHLIKPNGCITLGTCQKIKPFFDFDKFAWMALNIIFPSPRTSSFKDMMEVIVETQEEYGLDLSDLFSKSYKFESLEECENAFNDGINRPDNYLKGYIEFA